MIQSLTRDELIALLTAARARSERDWLLILIAFWHGLRATEVTQLRRDMFADGKLTVKRLKGSLRTEHDLWEHENPLLNERKALFDFLRNLHGNQRLFPITRRRFGQIMQECGELAGIPKAKRHPHALKHTIAMFSISSGIENARQYLGHKSISSTGAYLRLTDADAMRAVKSSIAL
jgi:integrase